MLKDNKMTEPVKRKFGIASIGLVSLASLLVVHAAPAVAQDTTPAAAQDQPLAVAAEEEVYYDDEFIGGFYIRGHSFALLDLTPADGSLNEFDQLNEVDEFKSIFDPTLSYGGNSVLLNRETGFGVGLMAGYDFEGLFIGGGYDYTTQKITANGMEGSLNNHMFLAEFGARFGGLLGFTLAGQYGLGLLHVADITFGNNGGQDISFLQHNLIGKLGLDVKLFDFVSFGVFSKYYYSFATENDESYNLDSSHTVAVGGFVGLTF